jgi:hypothetical protein
MHVIILNTHNNNFFILGYLTSSMENHVFLNGIKFKTFQD